MRSNNILQLIETHVEKGLLGLAVLFALGLAGYYLVLGPNRIEYNGTQVGPDEIDEAVAQQAERLRTAYRNAEPQLPAVPAYAGQLQASFSAGIFANEPNVPAVPRELRVATAFGPPLPPLPGLEEEERNIVLADVLPPTKPVTLTGSSLLFHQAVITAQTTGTTPPPTAVAAAAPEAEEKAWVTVGAWLPREAQKREMTKHKYAGYRAHVDVTGVELQRQELLPSGEYSDWEDVPTSLAALKFDIPSPVFDERSGEVLNRNDLNTKLEEVKANQPLVLQPPFYDIEAGDDWDVPFPSLRAKDEVPVEESKKPEPKPEEAPRPSRPPPVGLPPGIGGGPGGRPPGVGYPPGGGATRAPRAADDTKTAREQASQHWSDAQKNYRQGNLQGAATDCQWIIDNVAQHKNRGLEKKAKHMKQAIQRKQDRGRKSEAVAFVRNDNADKDPGVWFHDDSVEPGKTYRYRMRVRIWNRYVGKRDVLQDPTNAEKTELTGEWSLPSDPVTVAPETFFFVRGATSDDAVNVEVFKRYRGDWYKESFTVRVGDEIGELRDVKTAEVDDKGNAVRSAVDFRTGAVVLDIRNERNLPVRQSSSDGQFRYYPADAMLLTYLAPADGQVIQRIDRDDRASPLYTKLSNELSEF